MASSPKQFLTDGAQYCVIAAPFGCLGIATEMVDASLMVSKIEYLPASATLLSPKNALAKRAEKPLNLLEQSISKRFGELFRRYRLAKLKLMEKLLAKSIVVPVQLEQPVVPTPTPSVHLVIA